MEDEREDLMKVFYGGIYMEFELYFIGVLGELKVVFMVEVFVCKMY